MSDTKKYNGKIFKRHSSASDGSVFTEKNALRIQKRLKKKGWNARIQYRSRQHLYLVWKRKK